MKSQRIDLGTHHEILGHVLLLVNADEVSVVEAVAEGRQQGVGGVDCQTAL